MKNYISWNKSLKLKRYSDQIIVMEVYEDLEKRKCHSFSLNATGAEIIRSINGTRTYDEVIALLSEKYNEKYDVVDMKVTEFIMNLSKQHGIDVIYSRVPKHISYEIVDEKSMYPKVVTLELTDRCNIKCLHCYGDYGKVGNHDMSLDDIKKVLFQFEELGVHTIELTGGEITIHPDLKEILLYTLSLRYDQISFLSNGIALTEEIMDIIIQNKSRFVVQIDIHSLDDDYLHWFTKAPRTLDRIKRNIMKLAENNVKMRTATVITRRNMKEIEEIADWVHSLNIEHFGISPVLSLGRAMGADNDLYLTSDDMVLLEEKLNIINNKYSNFISIIDSNRSESKNCGALTSHCVVSSRGDVKICTMDNLKYFDSSIGNVLEKDIKTLYHENRDYILAFFNMPSPQLDSSECMSCPNIYYCSACVLRGLIKAKEIGDNCTWYKNKIPALIKEKLLI